MYLQHVQIRAFRGIAHAELDFGEGVNVLFGPNEAGKSTFLTATGAALFTNADASSREVKSFRSWNSQADPSVRLLFRAAGRDYELEKTFLGEKKGRLLCPATGLETANKDRINEELSALLPLYTSDGQSMRNTFWIEQQQLESTVQTLQKDANLRTVLQNILFSNNADIEEIKRFVKKQVRDLGIGTRGAAVKNPGPVARAEADVRRLAQEVEAMRRELAAVQEESERLHTVEQRVAELQAVVEEDRRTLDAEKAYAEAKRRRDDANRELDTAIETIVRYERAHEAIAELRTRVAELEEKLKNTDAVFEILKRSDDIPRMEDAIRRGQEILNDAREFDRQIAAVIRRQAGSRPVERTDFETARRMEQTIQSKREALEAVQIAVEVRAVRRMDAVARSDDKIVRNAEVASGEVETFRANRTLRLSLDGLAEITVSTGAGGATQLQYELEETERTLTALLRKNGADSMQILAERFTLQQQLAAERDRAENQKAGRLGKLTVERIEAGVKKYVEDIEAIRRRREALGLQPGETTEVWQERKTELVRRHTEALTELRRYEEAVALFTERYGTIDNAQAQRREFGREAAKAEAVLEELQPVEIPQAEAMRIRRRFEESAAELERLQREYHTLLGSLRRSDVSAERLQLKEAELEEAEALLRRYTLEFQAYQALEQAIEESEQEIADQLTEPVEKIAVSLLPVLTEGRYTGITLDKDLRITGVRYEGMDVRPDELSAGAQGQLALAIRLALIDYIGGNERQTVILDDALVHFDTPRLEEAKRLLTRFSAAHQIIYMSCHERMRDWKGARVITVGRSVWKG